MAPKNYYEILGVERNATDKEIRQAYRTLAASMQAQAADNVTLEKIQDINKAYEILSDPKDRQQYDAFIAQAQAETQNNASAALSTGSALAFTDAPASPKSKRKSGVVVGVIVNLLMLVFGVIIGFAARPIVMPPPDPQSAALQKVIAATRHFKGNDNVPVTIVEFGDFQ